MSHPLARGSSATRRFSNREGHEDEEPRAKSAGCRMVGKGQAGPLPLEKFNQAQQVTTMPWPKLQHVRRRTG
jgi:hypothetical protein